jgi:hypothetical protein
MHNPLRNFLTRGKGVTRDLAPILWAGLPRKLAPRSIATCARKMGAHLPLTIPRIVVDLRKIEWKNPTSSPQERRKETQSHKALFCTVSEKMDTLEKVTKKQDARRNKCHRSDSDSDSK